MLYLFIFIVILFLAIFELSSKYIMEKLFNVIFLIITLIAAFRYGVGTDYFGYMNIYNVLPKLDDPYFSTFETHGEYGYKLIQGIFKLFNLDYTILIFVISIITMYLFYYYIKKNSKSYMVSLLIFYSMYYFTYINNGIRQGLTIGLFLTILLPLLKKKQYWQYIILTLLFSLIHTSIIVVLILPLIRFDFNKETFLLIIAGATLLSFMNIGFLLKPFGNIYISYQTYLSSRINLLSILSRIIIFIIVIILYKNTSNNVNLEDKSTIKYYIIGIIIYVVFSRSELMASRLNVYFKCFEISLIPNMIKMLKDNQKKYIISYAICIIMITMWAKEISGALEQGVYYNKVNILNYPYVSIFNKDDIYNYRYIDYSIKDNY